MWILNHVHAVYNWDLVGVRNSFMSLSSSSDRHDAIFFKKMLCLYLCYSVVCLPGDNNFGDDRLLYAHGQLWLQRHHIMGRAVGWAHIWHYFPWLFVKLVIRFCMTHVKMSVFMNTSIDHFLLCKPRIKCERNHRQNQIWNYIANSKIL